LELGYPSSAQQRIPTFDGLERASIGSKVPEREALEGREGPSEGYFAEVHQAGEVTTFQVVIVIATSTESTVRMRIGRKA
jgi:hypothetical protein